MQTTPDLRVARVAANLTTIARIVLLVGRVPLAAVLAIFEPVIRAVLSFAMVLGFVAALVFEISAVGPQFPSFAVFALSLGCGLTLVAYHGLLSLVSR